VVAGSRDVEAIADLSGPNVELRKVDFDDPDLVPAFAGVDRVLLISTVSPNRRDQQRRAVEAAKAAGVRHLVYTSAPNPRPNPSAAAISDHYWTEVAIAATNLGFTVLRNHIYAEVTTMGLDAARATGQLFDATEGKGRSYVTRLDAARTAAGALLLGEGQEIHDVTGPEAITQEQLATELSRLIGQTITRVGLTGDELRAGLTSAGAPSFMADLLVAFDLDAAEGHHAIVSDAVELFTGRKPERLAEFLARSVR
jgi:NAD(P)H dehydrogenase (quinone)